MILSDSHVHLAQLATMEGNEKLQAIFKSYAAHNSQQQDKAVLVDIGTELEDLAQRHALYSSVWASVRKDTSPMPNFIALTAGLWPSAPYVQNAAASVRNLEKSIQNSRNRNLGLQAIGECGLDYFHKEGSPQEQKELFLGQIRLARSLELPLIVHSRNAAKDTLDCLKEARVGRNYSGVKIIMHCFSYGTEEAKAFLDLGCWISFAGNLTYPKAEEIRHACSIIPKDKILLETDTPYLFPSGSAPAKGRKSSPLDIEITYALAATIRMQKLDELVKNINANLNNIFNFYKEAQL